MTTLSSKDQMIAYFAAQGMNNTDIAEELKCDKATVATKLKDSRIQFEIKRLRYKLYGGDHQKRFRDLLPHAIDATERILVDPNAKPNLKFAAAQEIMDRALGKPKQTVEHEGSLIRALFERLDGKAKEENPTIDVPLAEVSMMPLLENPNTIIEPAENPNLSVDPIDKWAKENL